MAGCLSELGFALFLVTIALVSPSLSSLLRSLQRLEEGWGWGHALRRGGAVSLSRTCVFFSLQGALCRETNPGTVRVFQGRNDKVGAGDVTMRK